MASRSVAEASRSARNDVSAVSARSIADFKPSRIRRNSELEASRLRWSSPTCATFCSTASACNRAASAASAFSVCKLSI